MKKIDKIMLVYNDPDDEDEALVFAAGVAEDFEAKLIVATVINRRDINAVKTVEIYSPQLNVKDYIKKRRNYLSESIDNQISVLPQVQLQIEKIIMIGIPVERLIDTVKNEDVGLVIVGSKRKSGLAGLFLNSMSKKLLRRCLVPVLNVPCHDHTGKTIPAGKEMPHKLAIV